MQLVSELSKSSQRTRRAPMSDVPDRNSENRHAARTDRLSPKSLEDSNVRRQPRAAIRIEAPTLRSGAQGTDEETIVPAPLNPAVGLLMAAMLVGSALALAPLASQALVWFVNGMRWFAYGVH